MDPLNYNEYNYKVSNNPYMYNVKDEPILNSSGKQNHTATTIGPNSIQNFPNPINVPTPMQPVPNSIQSMPNSIESFPNVSLNQPSVPQKSALPQNMLNVDNIPPADVNNALGTCSNQIPYEDNNAAVPTDNTQDTEMIEDSKEDLKPLLAKVKGKRRKKPHGKVSSYWNKKITDANFPFYGCAICNISFTALQELDQHVPIHKGRLTSYDLRLKNQRKRKLLKKESKKLKKLSKKLKKENVVSTYSFDIEIKPEDGYIGSEKATDYAENATKIEINNDTSNVNGQNGEESSNTEEKKDKIVDSNLNEQKNQGNGANTDEKEIKVDKGKTIEYADKDEKLGKDDPRLEKLFKCFACQKQFSLGYYLKLHVRSHTDEKPYTCAQCGQSFITASKLGRHNKRIHLAIRYQCRICYRLFTRFEYLVRHFDKKHAEQKLEGEPYDFNAILPYLKELEEQLMQKVEESKDIKEPKPETQDWGVEQGGPQEWGDIKPDRTQTWGQEIKQDESTQDSQHLDVFLQPTVDVIIDEVEKVEIEVKKEKEEFDYEDVKDEGFHNDDSFCNVNPKDESVSDDEDYFPANTWAAPVAEPPEPERRRFRRKDFPLQCEFCEKTISSLTYMKVHLRTHTGEKPFKCYICGRGFITSSKMHRHVLTHGDVPLEDPNKVEPDTVPDDPEKADGDAADDVTKKGKSSKRKKKKGLQAVRTKKKYQPRPHACPFCHKRFLHEDTLRVHQKCHVGETRVLKCNFCLEEQPDEETLKTHEGSHTGPRPFLCTVCNRTYTKKESMVYHKKSHSTDADRKTFVCDICSKTFNEQCKLQRHIVSHRTDKFTLRYECPVCAHMFHTRYHVEMHLATHLKEGTISEHNRSEILAMVLQNARKIPKPGSVLGAPPPEIIPSDERSTVCNICGEVFQHFYFLEEHLKSHGSKIAIEDLSKKEEEIKKHICPVCNKGFKLPYYLKLHSFTHTKEKPFICQQCGKGFITKGKLKRHLESHTGLKKYQCHICYKYFTRPSYQRIHVRTIHGTQDYNFRLESFGKQFDMYSESSG